MTENPAVVDGFVDVYNQWVDLGVDGFRIDTAKHVNFEFWQKFTTGVRDHAASIGNDDFFMFGEVYDADPVKLAPYLRDSDMNAVLDFTFQSAASNYAKGFSADGLQALYAGDDRYTTPTTNAQALPTFLGNHDMGRIGYFVKDANNPEQRSELAHSLMYLTRGQPVVYYGDEQGFVGDGTLNGTDKDARQSLFATQVSRVREPEPARRHARGLGRPVRHRLGAVRAHRRAGRAAQRAPRRCRTAPRSSGYADGAVYAFSRVDAAEKVEHLVATNNGTAPATVTIDTLTPGATFAPLYGTSTSVTAAADGTVSVTIPALSAIVLKAGADRRRSGGGRRPSRSPPRRPAPA